MRLLLFSQLLAIVFYSGLYAQGTQENNLVNPALQVSNPNTRNEIAPIKSIYRFPTFVDGQILLHNGDTTTGQFNYNISRDQMHFIGPKNDTFYISDPVGINFISFNDCRFYYHKDYYLQSLFIIDGIVLAFRQNFVVVRVRSIDGSRKDKHYIEAGNFDYYTAEGKRIRLTDDPEMPLGSQERYYFGDQYGNFVEAGKRFIFDHYIRHQVEIKSYIKAENIHFTKPDEMKRLLEYCATLNK